jgi:hypothetical protein
MLDLYVDFQIETAGNVVLFPTSHDGLRYKFVCYRLRPRYRPCIFFLFKLMQ